MRDIVYFDLETQRTAHDAGGWERKRDMGMSIGVTFSTASGEYRIYSEAGVNDQERAQTTGKLLIIGAAFQMLLFLYGATRRSYLALALPVTLCAQQKTDWEVRSPTEESSVEYDFGTQTFIATNGVLIKYGDAVLTAERATLNQETGEAVADGTVRIQQQDLIYAGDHISYNFKTRQMEAQQFRTGKSPVFAMGHGLHADMTNRVYSATNAYITADDVA